MERRLWLAICLLLGAMPIAAHAQVCSGTSTALDFGTIGATPTARRDTTSSMSVTCTGTVGQTVRACVGIPPGAGTSSTLANRRMNSGANIVQFQIYKDVARTQIWGLVGNPQTPLTLDIPITSPSGNTDMATAYGRIFSGQVKPAGNYVSNFSLANRVEVRPAYVVSPTNPDCSTYAGAATGWAFQALVTLGAVCTVTASDIGFGTVISLASQIDATGTVQSTCTTGTVYTIAMDGGTTTGNIPDRRMAKSGPGPDFVGYQLYRDAAHTQIWGDGVVGSVEAGTGTGSTQSVTVYGRVPAQSTPEPDLYADTIGVTMTY